MAVFRCPESLDKYRIEHPLTPGNKGDRTHGALLIKEQGLKALFSNSLGWEHVSVSRRSKMPSWQDMDWIRRQFWSEDCTAMQLHVPPADHIDLHKYCLHLWRPTDGQIPRPPHYMVSKDDKQEERLSLPVDFVAQHCPQPEDTFQGHRFDQLTREELLSVVGWAMKRMANMAEVTTPEGLDALVGRPY